MLACCNCQSSLKSCHLTLLYQPLPGLEPIIVEAFLVML